MNLTTEISQTNVEQLNPAVQMYQWNDEMNYYNIYTPTDEKRGKVSVYIYDQNTNAYTYKFCYFLEIKDLPQNASFYYSQEQIENARSVVQNHLQFTDVQLAYIQELLQFQLKTVQDELIKHYNDFQQKIQEENIKYQKVLQQITLKDQIIQNLNQTNQSLCIQYYDIQSQLNAMKQRNVQNRQNRQKSYLNVTQQKPETTQQKPEITQQKPETTQQEPEITQQKPETTQQEPEITQQKPEITHQKSEITQQKPEITQQKPEITQQKPEITQQEPVVTQQQSEKKVTFKSWAEYDEDDKDDVNVQIKRESKGNVWINKPFEPRKQNIIENDGWEQVKDKRKVNEGQRKSNQGERRRRKEGEITEEERRRAEGRRRAEERRRAESKKTVNQN